MHPALCGWLSQAIALLDAQQRLAARVIGLCARDTDAAVREALAAAAWVAARHQGELSARVVELFGAAAAPALGDGLDAPPATADAGLRAVTAAAQATRDAWRAALPRVDAHTRLVLRLQLAQLDSVVLPALEAVGAAHGPPSVPAAPLVAVLASHLPPAPSHPEAFLVGD